MKKMGIIGGMCNYKRTIPPGKSGNVCIIKIEY